MPTEQDTRISAWLDFVLSQFDAGRFLANAHRGIFDAAQGEAFCNGLEDIEIPKSIPASRDLERTLISRLWFLPIYMERQTGTLAKNRGDVWRYLKVTGEVTRAIYAILGDAERSDDLTLPSSAYGFSRTDLVGHLASAFQNVEPAFGLRFDRAETSFVRYKSEHCWIVFRFRKYDARPRLELGRPTERIGEGFPLEFVLEAILGRPAYLKAVADSIESGSLESYLDGLLRLLSEHCRGHLEGDLGTAERIKGHHQTLNDECIRQVTQANRLGVFG
jgi:hypothetical protein